MRIKKRVHCFWKCMHKHELSNIVITNLLLCIFHLGLHYKCLALFMTAVLYHLFDLNQISYIHFYNLEGWTYRWKDCVLLLSWLVTGLIGRYDILVHSYN